MSSRWTQVRRLPVRRVLSVIQSINPAVTIRFRGMCCGVMAVFLVLGIRPQATASADGLQAQGVREPAANLVSDLFNALSRCQAPLSESERWRLAGAIHHLSRLHGYDPMFVMAMIQVESGCSPTARGERGSVGLVQLKPSTARAIAKQAGVPWHGPETLTRPVVNVQLALLYLSGLERQFGDPYLAMVAFNKGPARVGHMSRQRARGARYVKKILARYEDLTDEAAAAL
jgi:soluble lytic murein transglycosylase-like protein